MAIDLSQFHQTFFEESLEGLAEMEAELLRIEAGISGDDHAALFEADRESLNTIFRAVHSIKGGSSTFGFTQVAEFSHVLETLLDDLREGRCEKSRALVSVLLRSVDTLRALLQGAQDGTEVMQSVVNGVLDELKQFQVTEAVSHQPLRQDPGQLADVIGWNIVFRPHRNLFLTGNDPLRILRALSDMGKLEADVDTSAFPSWKEFNAEDCVLAWTMRLHAPVSEQQIRDTFMWVQEECDLELQPIHGEVETVASVAAETTGQGEDRRENERRQEDRRQGDRRESQQSMAQSIRVSIPKIDEMIDLVGELVITQTMLNRFNGNLDMQDLPLLFESLAQLERNTRELQESVMRIRMLPVSFAFNRLPRAVRDLGQQLGKEVELKIIGEQTELDKTVIERISDPLMHLVRNCVDHGIEMSKERRQAGKSDVAIVRVEAYQKGGNVIIEIEDDGKGIDRERVLKKAIERGLVEPDAELTAEEIDELIFLPGFSTAEKVTDVSGRGVGMDVVRSNIRALGGSVELKSAPGEGTLFTMRLPLTLAIMDGLSISVGEHTYILPLLSVAESVCLEPNQISRPGGGSELFTYHDDYLPVLRLHRLFGITPKYSEITDGIVVVVDVDGKQAGIFVDELVGQQQVVVKSLEAHYKKVDGIATATILGDGEVALILDISTLARMAHKSVENVPDSVVTG
jgi:two-component system chemotaxis sensor kinase CheA